MRYPRMRTDELPKPTPEYELKPKLIFVGRLLGMDLYLDTHGVSNPEQKHAMVINLLRQQFYPPKEEEIPPQFKPKNKYPRSSI